MAKKSTKKSDAETKLQFHIQDIGLPKPDSEVTFYDSRKWRFDFAWVELMLAVEVEGGTWTGGRHVRPKGFEDDCEKYNKAATMGWKVIRVTTTMIGDGRAIKAVEEAYDASYEAMLS